MAVSPASKLSKEEQRELWEDLNYLNTAEIKAFCKLHSIPYTIAIETGDGHRRRTKDDDRKGVMLNRIRHFLQTGVALEETCFRSAVVCFETPPKKITATDRLFYGQYDKTNRTMIALLKDLTGGRFKDGAIARIVARDFWTSGTAPTFREYASSWLQASREYIRPNPEWAYLADRVNKGAIPDWKRMRANKASKIMRVLKRITTP
jgi:hypothetical protein